MWPLTGCLLRALLRLLGLVSPPVHHFLRRLRDSPGIPVPNPSVPYWSQTPSSIAQCNADPTVALPECADIVVIGSGITGTSFARAILDHESNMRLVMLEARDACSGATARNGGHISPMLYQEYISLKQKHGKDMAAEIIRFRLSHLTHLLAVAKEEGLLHDSQCRTVDKFDVFYDKNLFRKAQSWLYEYQHDLPEEGAQYKVYNTPEQLSALQLAQAVVGCISTQAGAVHSYQLVTGILTRLLSFSNFNLYTHTPCTEIRAPEDDDQLYTVETPRGSVRTPHIVHATNGWASHLLPEMRGKIIPARAVMTARAPLEAQGNAGSHLAWAGTRSFVFYPRDTAGVYDYLTQQPSTPGRDGEMMLGGGFACAVVSEMGNVDDAGWDPRVEDYLRKAAPFSAKEGPVKAVWSGILGLSTDEQPWVGRVPQEVAGRQAPVDGGEWIAAGYSGEGMVHAWQSGSALATMVLGGEGALPDVYRMSRARCEGSGIEDLVWAYLVE